MNKINDLYKKMNQYKSLYAIELQRTKRYLFYYERQRKIMKETKTIYDKLKKEYYR